MNDGILEVPKLFSRASDPKEKMEDEAMGDGEKRFLGIGNNRYREHAELIGAAGDMEAVARVLAVRYGFVIGASDLLVDATCKQMNEALERYVGMDAFDTLVLYYAGHGYTDKVLGRSYWLPVDAGTDRREKVRWLDSGAVAGNVLAQIPARHILVVSDSCFSGDILQARDITEERSVGWEERAPLYKSREMLTSGMDTPVADAGLGGHSPFAYHLLDALEHNPWDWIDPMGLYEYVKRGVKGQAPQFGRLSTAGHQEGGACILWRIQASPSEAIEITHRISQATTNPEGRCQAFHKSGLHNMKQAELFVSSEPLNAEVTIDGAAKGRTPVYFDEVVVGEALVVEARLGTLYARKEHRVQEGFNELALMLEQEHGNVLIQTAEHGAEMYVDGVRVGTVGSGLLRDMAVGGHEIELRLPGRNAVNAVEVMKDATVRMVPVFNGLRYEVTLDAQGGLDMEKAGKQVRHGEAYGELPVPKRKGCSFGGWWTLAGTDGTQVVTTTECELTAPQTLYARWNANRYTVGFDSQGGDAPSMESKSVVYGEPYGTLATVERTGYGFSGWWTGPGGTDVMVEPGTKMTTDGAHALYAKWIALSIPMTQVEGGTFQMGSTIGGSDEHPVHTVTVDSFSMGTYEVTQDIYALVMGSNPSNWKGAHLPVEQVSWYDAVAFCNALSRKVGLDEVYTIDGKSVSCDWNKRGYRLPTEAEWEYAARGGNRSREYTYAGSDTVGDVAWYSHHIFSFFTGKTYEVGGKKPNELGLYDMSGNVDEWCWDWKGDYSTSAVTNPRGPSSGSYRVLRGGSWNFSAEYVRTAYRFFSDPSDRYDFIGFRVSAPVV